MSRKVLGRGLDALISQDSVPLELRTPERIRQIPVDQIRPNPHQPRVRFDDSKLEELSRSIRASGVLGAAHRAPRERWRLSARRGGAAASGRKARRP